MSVFRGRYYHSIDEKGRIMFPARLCQVFTEKYDERMVITNWDGCLLVFPYSEWIAIEEKVFQQSIIRKEVRAFQRLFMSGAVDCSFNAQRRVLIPPPLRGYAKLEKEIVIAGMGRSIEIWNREMFEKELERSSQDVEAFSDYMADLGI
ncbi:MAG: division/cell wall cluster transcriptional repressor MraZ [Deltaproteobacteria bacterium]|nr:division/cell wall cluster transcriptional repressor MraZ [Deltaproteobacteria bacterium]